MAYAVGTTLYVRSVAGGTVRSYPLPWVPFKLLWSPDGTRIALVDYGNPGAYDIYTPLLIVDLESGHENQLSQTAAGAIWSPNGRYLAFDVQSGGELWDSATSVIRQLPGPVDIWPDSASFSHDSARLIIERGLEVQNGGHVTSPPLAVLNIAQGSVTPIGVGQRPTWSPDDRYISFTDYAFRGNTFENGSKVIVPAAGGRQTVLMKEADSEHDNNEWRTVPGGYTFDRWRLDRAGHIVRQVVDQKDWVVSWAPDGREVLTETYGDTLPLNLVPLSGKEFVVTEAGTACPLSIHGAVYPVTWQSDSSAFALAPVAGGCGGKRYTPYFATLPALSGGGRPVPIAVPGAPLAYSADDQRLFVGDVTAYDSSLNYPLMTMRAYDVATRAVAVVASGASAFALQPVAAQSQTLASLSATCTTRVAILLDGIGTASKSVAQDFKPIIDRVLPHVGYTLPPVLFSYRFPQAYEKQDTYIALPTEAVNALRATVTHVLAVNPGGCIDLIGWSLGGAVAFQYAVLNAMNGPVGAHIKHLITLDSPVNGSSQLTQLAYLAGLADLGGNPTGLFLADERKNSDIVALNERSGRYLSERMVVRTSHQIRIWLCPRRTRRFRASPNPLTWVLAWDLVRTY